MKTCPNCGELLGDYADACIKCRYDYKRGRVITSEELAEQRNKRLAEQQKMIEEAREKEEQKKSQIAKNPLFEYQVIIVNDLPDGSINDDDIQKKLNEWSIKGWKLHTIFTSEIGKTATSTSVGGFGTGINATIDQTILVFERCIKS